MEQLKMISFARVYVELEASKACCDTIKVLLNGAVREVEVEYEWKPLSCQKCGVFDHRCSVNIPCPAQPEQENLVSSQDAEHPAVMDGQAICPVSSRPEVVSAPALVKEWQQIRCRSGKETSQPALVRPTLTRPSASSATKIMQKNGTALGVSPPMLKVVLPFSEPASLTSFASTDDLDEESGAAPAVS